MVASLLQPGGKYLVNRSTETGSWLASRFQGRGVGAATRQVIAFAVGSRWTIRRLPVPPVPPGEEPLVLPVSVSCASATACVAVGSNQAATMAERWNGTTWTVQPAPNPGGERIGVSRTSMKMGATHRLISVVAGARGRRCHELCGRERPVPLLCRARLR